MRGAGSVPASASPSLGAGRRRAIRDAGCLAGLLHDYVVVGGRHDPLDFGVFVAGEDEEVAGVAAHLPIDVGWSGEALGAAIVGALADEERRLAGLLPGVPELLGLFVDLPEKGLVACCSFFPERHGWQRLTCRIRRESSIVEIEMSAQEQQRLTTRSENAFEANERLARTAAALHFVSRVPMFCECSDPRCRALALITVDRYREVRADPTLCLTAAEHTPDGTQLVAQESGFWLHRKEA